MKTVSLLDQITKENWEFFQIGKLQTEGKSDGPLKQKRFTASVDW